MPTESLDRVTAASPMWAAADAGLARREVEHLRYVQERPHEAAMEDESARERFELSPVAAGVALLGAALTVAGLFLAAYETVGFSQVEQNTLIQHGVVVWTVVIFGALFMVDLALA